MKYRNIAIFFGIISLILLLFIILIFLLLFNFKIFPPFSSTNSTIKNNNIDLDSLKIELVTDNLEIPWAIVFPDKNTILVTERTGKIIQIKNDEKRVILDLTEEVVAIGEAGLMSMVLDPDFKNNKNIYIYHTYEFNSEVQLKIDKYRYENNSLIKNETIIDNIPSGTVHSGGEIAFGPDNKLYITTGDIAKADLAQDLTSLAGKTLRINKDGTIPTDNPFFYMKNARKEIWSLGHRNAQGIDWHPLTLEMYQSEHGPSGFDGGVGMDEINLVRRGQNYGWPIIRGNETMENLFSPLTSYTPAIAPASIVFVRNENSSLNNHMLVATLRGEAIVVLKATGEELKEIGSLASKIFGRIRELKIGPDGNIYFTTSNKDGRGEERLNDDKIYRITI